MLQAHPDHIEALHIVRATIQNLNTDLIVTEAVAVEERMTKKRTNREMIKTLSERVHQTEAVRLKTILPHTRVLRKALKVNHPQRKRVKAVLRNLKARKNLSRRSKKLIGKSMNANLKKTNDWKKKDNA